MKPTEFITSDPLESLKGPEKTDTEKLKKAQKNFESIKMLKVFLKNTKGQKDFQKKILSKVFKIKNKKPRSKK